MSKITFTIGQGLDSAGKPIRGLKAKRKLALAAIAQRFGGYTATSALGGWIDHGKLIEEPSLAVTVYTGKTHKAIHDAAQALRKTFGQTSVLVATEPANTQFVGA